MPKTDVKTSQTVIEPAYLRGLYGFLYSGTHLAKFLDDDRIQTLLTFGFETKLIDDMLEDIGTNSSVLQIGCTFGSQMQKTAEKIGKYGSYVVADVSKTQLKEAKTKLINQKIEFKLHDARKPFNAKYDTVICFMLLHELPETSRSKIINNALDAVKTGGKVLFIDAHEPLRLNVLRYILKPFNRLFFPFTEKLWTTPIKDYARKSAHFIWYQKTYGMEMFQKVTAVRKVSDEKKPTTKPSFY